MMYLGDLLRRNCLLYGNAPALTYDGRTWSYREFNDEVNRLAHALAAADVQPQDHVAVYGKNSAEYVIAYFGCAAARAILSCANYRLSNRELTYIITNTEANLLLLDGEFVDTWESIKDSCPNITRVVIIGGGEAPGYESYAQFVEPHPMTPPDGARHEDDVAIQMYTSGTTGVPKGAMLTHRGLITVAVACSQAFSFDPGDKYLVSAPLYHMAAGMSIFISMLVGGHAWLHHEFNPVETLDAFENDGVTHALLIPAMILFLLQMPDIASRTFPDLKLIIYGASPMPGEVLSQAMAAFKCDFVQAYGQTESHAVLTVLGAEEHRMAGERGEELRKSAGREILGTEVRIVNEDASPCTPGEWGEVIARGPLLMKGYWRMEEATARTLRGGWLWTGDIGYLDEEGYIYIVDRSKDMIISGGENIYPREIEEVLYTHPAVMDAAVIGVPSGKWGEDVKACVVLKADAEASDEAIIAFCREQLAGFKCPKTVDFVDELPRNLSGKVLKKDLRAPYWEGQERQVH